MSAILDEVDGRRVVADALEVEGNAHTVGRRRAEEGIELHMVLTLHWAKMNELARPRNAVWAPCLQTGHAKNRDMTASLVLRGGIQTAWSEKLDGGRNRSEGTGPLAGRSLQREHSMATNSPQRLPLHELSS